MQTKVSAQRFCCLFACFTSGLLIVALLHLCTSMPLQAQTTPQIAAGFLCLPGGEGTVIGEGFAASISTTVSINAQPVGEVTTEVDGRILFVIELPPLVLSSTYTVAVSSPISITGSTIVTATDTFTVSYQNAPHCLVARAIDENGMIIELQSVVLPDWAQHQFLPLIRRHESDASRTSAFIR